MNSRVYVENVLTGDDHQGTVNLHASEPVTAFTPAQARELAGYLLQAAAGAEQEEAIYMFMTDAGGTEGQALGYIDELRGYQQTILQQGSGKLLSAPGLEVGESHDEN